MCKWCIWHKGNTEQWWRLMCIYHFSMPTHLPWCYMGSLKSPRAAFWCSLYSAVMPSVAWAALLPTAAAMQELHYVLLLDKATQMCLRCLIVLLTILYSAVRDVHLRIPTKALLCCCKNSHSTGYRCTFVTDTLHSHAYATSHAYYTQMFRSVCADWFAA